MDETELVIIKGTKLQTLNIGQLIQAFQNQYRYHTTETT
jgi:hypothetical protein